jgi:hypothetical protein
LKLHWNRETEWIGRPNLDATAAAAADDDDDDGTSLNMNVIQ